MTVRHPGWRAFSFDEPEGRPAGPAVETIDVELKRLVTTMEFANGLNAYCRDEDCGGGHGEIGDVAFLIALLRSIGRK